MNGVVMRTFTIDPDNNITALLEVPGGADNAFINQKELAKLTADWPMSRLLDLWNSFAGVTPFDDLKPVKKFTDRKGAVARIWKAVQRLSPDLAQQEPVPPAKGKAKKFPIKGERGDTVRAGAKGAATVARESSKKGEVLDLMRRKSGATLTEIMTLTGCTPFAASLAERWSRSWGRRSSPSVRKRRSARTG